MTKRPTLTTDAGDEKARWSAAEALIKQQHEKADKIWKHLMDGGVSAIHDVMDYLSEIERQNKRLNMRINVIEKMLINLDFSVQILKKFPDVKRYDPE